MASLKNSIGAIVLAVAAYKFLTVKKPEIAIVERINSTYDYVIVGAGSAGAVLAARLTEDPHTSVLLLEAGGDDRDYSDIFYPATMTKLWVSEAVTRFFYTEKQTDMFSGLQYERSFWPRGVVLGGCSSVNGLLWVRGNRHDYDNWAKHTGNESWSWRHVLPYFKMAERVTDPGHKKSAYRGAEGPLPVSVMGQGSAMSDTIIKAFEEIGYPFNPDLNGKTMEGIANSQTNMADKERWSTARGYLHPALSRPNLHISLHSFVTKVVIDEKNVATGVEFVKNNRKSAVFAKKEVILSGGAIQSPQMLMLSGVGPKAELKKFGIPVKSDLPVGKNLQDHVFFYMSASVEAQLGVREGAGPDSFWAWLQHKVMGSGPLGRHAQENMFFTSLSEENKRLDWPELQVLFFSKGMSRKSMKSLSYSPQLIDELAPLKEAKPDGWICRPSLLRPRSVGHLSLKSTDPFDDPVITANYLIDQEDVDVLNQGTEICRRVIHSKTMQAIGAKLTESAPISVCSTHKFDTPPYWECVMRATLNTIYHPSGTCKMGPVSDPTSVVDPELKVKGVAHLRVIDASVMPMIPSANTHAGTVMIAEKLADIIRGRPALAPLDLY